MKVKEVQEYSEKDKLIHQFVKSNPQYYIQRFQKIGNTAGWSWTFNKMAALLGPVWFGTRGMWNWGLSFLIMETFAFVQIVMGFFGDVASEAKSRVSQVEATLTFRREQLATAIENNSEKIDLYKRTVDSLEKAIDGIRLEVQQIEDSGIWIAIIGILLLIIIKLIEGFAGNNLLEKRFSDWLSEPSISTGMTLKHWFFSSFFVLIIVSTTVTHYSFPGHFEVLNEFPTDKIIRVTAINWVENFFNFTVLEGERFFDGIKYSIRIILDFLEIVFVETPWLVVSSIIVLLTRIAAGVRSAIIAGAFLAYMGLLGFWDKAMMTLALLGTAACLSVLIGIPLGMFCARRQKFYSFIRPIMDFMQTMPAFVFMIPVIAFFGTGKPAAVVTTMIFGGTPVVRLTVLGLRGVPESVREAAIAYGASKWYLLTKVDLPLAAPSIIAGINQTIMLSLAMVVVASLIGAKGLGEDVLEALQYANVGMGILAGFAILFCAMILDRIISGNRK
ncbi:MAG: ABC transporter permease subunit [Candidatus Marinimicrobia bacterium]|nr:ABC transporter permease subunit [Candidatus Neomarinimicrobiota bacterium]